MVTLGVLVGGGPAPGINGVVAAAAAEARRLGWRTVGFVAGFRHLVSGPTRLRDLDPDELAPLAARGGSVLKTSRDAVAEGDWPAVVRALGEAGVDRLVTIGGEGTTTRAARLSREHGVRVAHVPKTIDDDLPIPAHLHTFGFETARDWGARIVHNLAEDARSTDRWYVVVTMGREAGHLALGIGKAAGAAVTVIPEEFGERDPIRFADVCDVLEGAVLKRRARGLDHGVAVLAEGLAGRLDLRRGISREEYGRVAEADLASLVRDELRRRLAERGVATSVIAKNVGYELRSADPVPSDVAYARDLGYAAVRYLAEGGSGAIVTMDGGRLVPIPFDRVLDGAFRCKVRLVDTSRAEWRVALEAMDRITESDLADPSRAAAIARAAGTSPASLLARFGPVALPARPPETRRI